MRVGLNERTGQLLTGWAHCQQCIRRCLRTRFRTREMRYHLGSDVPELQDDNLSEATIFRFFAAIAEALSDPDGGEPGFRLQDIEVVASGARSGRIVFLLTGVFFPRGHLGDFSVYERQSTDWMLEAA